MFGARCPEEVEGPVLVLVHVQGSRIRFVLGCVIPSAGAVARSRNLGQVLFGSPVLVKQCRPVAVAT